MRKFLVPFLLLASICSAVAGSSLFTFGTYRTDIYALDYATPTQPWYTDTSGKGGAQSATISQPTLVLLVVSQSISASSTPTAYTPVNALAQQLSIIDGNVYRAIDPILGTTGQPPSGTTYGGSVLSRLADQIITDGKFSRVVIVPAVIGGTSVKDWSPDGPWSGRLRVALLRIRSMGWSGDANVTFRVLYDQGQQDVVLGTSQSAWQASFAKIVGTINGFGLGTPKICVAQDTMVSNVTNSTIRAAQSAVVDNVQVFSAGDLDTLTGTTNRQDGIHLTDAGAVNAVAILKSCIAP